MVPAFFVLLAQLDPVPVTRGHAHNDYEHKRPLKEALEAGLCSIEADIFLVDGELLVGHNKEDLKPERTLDALYLKPMAELARAHGGHMYKDWPEVTLLVDIKQEGEQVFPVLRKQLERYKDVVGRDKPGAFRAVVSGDCPRDLIWADKEQWMSVDGRPDDLGKGIPARKMPYISASWVDTFHWLVPETLPSDKVDLFKWLVSRTHEEGRVIRFWATPDNEKVWSFLYDSGVDLINTDRPGDLANWIHGRKGLNLPPMAPE